jgi:hypothetical protein
MEATVVSEVLVSVHRTARCHLPEDRHFSTELVWYLATVVSCVLANCTPRVGGQAEDYVITIDEPTGSGNLQLSDKIMSVCLPP